jgi:ligand-binding SRPBCC domain-containing protein
LFADKQLYGPYRSWNHEHEVARSKAGSTIIDRVYFQMPFGILGGFVYNLIVRRALFKAFSFRKSQLIKLYPSAENLQYSFQLKRIKA